MCVMNNMGQMGLALGYVDSSIFVSLTSIWGFFGRILSGLVSEYYLWKFGTPRPLWNAASQIVMCLGFVVMALALPGSLYIGSILVGICYGVRLTILSQCLRIIWSEILCSAGGGNVCVGPQCYFLIFLIMALACVLGFGLDVLLGFRTRKVYAKICEDKKSSRSIVA
ncbi:hypothetical protein GH714_034659 [Hevea brasiliensis]|uniref:NFD4 C-terminal domain-containing protein n=1 Tax=Hevea brasiliensis TaxID=3981 RepID=A0A6A6MK85_HEVBR|nr:hypothetical protein GH714_034659 [Hevea brasiliensis]